MIGQMLALGAGAAFLFSDLRSDFEPVDLGHLDIHENRIERLPLQGRESFQTVVGEGDRIASSLEQSRD